jgi:hypothetical protein
MRPYNLLEKTRRKNNKKIFIYKFYCFIILIKIIIILRLRFSFKFLVFLSNLVITLIYLYL